MAKKAINLTIEENLIKPAKRRALDDDISVSRVVEMILDAWLESGLTIEELLAKLEEDQRTYNDTRSTT